MMPAAAVIKVQRRAPDLSPALAALIPSSIVKLHIREWMALIGEGMTLFQTPWGTGLFGSAFFSITGLHLTHVTAGVIALIVVGIRYQRGRYKADDLEILGLYWHFVDIVWMFVVPLVYLLNLAHCYGTSLSHI